MDILRRSLRLAQLTLTAPRRPRIGLHDVARMSGRVWPTDLDELRHVNNGVYLSLMDLPRLDLLMRSGVWARFQKAGVYPVVASQTITYRKSLRLWQRFEIETRILGYDERAVYLEQRFVAGGELYARAYVKGRFLRRTGGVAPIAEVGELAGVNPTAHPIPEWLADWSRHVAMPSTSAPAPSEWDA
ncbi:acyl-CoA thioesterase [Naasia aerilata]|uniref:Thioesterase n=1 Tax=Naasia aerilata TaxID=1162966 RepID=A0ABN6XLE2_9MICO|nr:thioesterase family protein [Naasia aerilata]BDZ45699.1 thioesterase [Naasia aerilata]